MVEVIPCVSLCSGSGRFTRSLTLLMQITVTQKTQASSKATAFTLVGECRGYISLQNRIIES